MERMFTDASGEVSIGFANIYNRHYSLHMKREPVEIGTLAPNQLLNFKWVEQT